ncbi:MAG: hypothetical protein GX254_07950 [Clostridiales bacterium]|nr:hypothetical protein [Clostridiales bacterium]
MFRIDRSKVNMEAIKADIAEKRSKEAAHESVKGEKTIKISQDRLTAYADEIIKHAEQKARQLLQEAEEQALIIKRIARQKGYEEGLDEVAEKYEKAMEEARQQDRMLVGKLISELEQTRQDMLDSMEEEMISLVMAIAKKIFDYTVKTDGSMLEAMITKALKQIKKEGKISIRVSKEEYERFFSSGDASFIHGEGQLDISLLPDENMKGGDCVIESEGETVNIGLDSQLKYMEAAFRQSGGDME